MKGRDFEKSIDQFEAFRYAKCSPENVKNYLKSTPCILLIDEINLVEGILEKESVAGENFADFVKDIFLCRKNRYFIYSSHVLNFIGKLSLHMESVSSREVIVKQLPLIPSLDVARVNFKYSTLTDREALYYGLLPSLIYEAKIRSLPKQK